MFELFDEHSALARSLHTSSLSICLSTAIPCGKLWVYGRGISSKHSTMSVILVAKNLLIVCSITTRKILWAGYKLYVLAGRIGFYHGYGRL